MDHDGLVAIAADTIRIENPGYKTLTERVQVDAGNTIRKTYPLVPEG